MTTFADVPVKEFFVPTNGQAKFIHDFMDANPGPYPVYSASLLGHFGLVNEFRYDGHYLTWVMNGYGGRIQEIHGRFSANRDRGVFVPRGDVAIPDLTYIRFTLEPALMAAAVGRRVDGRANDYTKIYPDTAGEITIPVPLNASGQYDYKKMLALGDRFRRIEAAQRRIYIVNDLLRKSTYPLKVETMVRTVSLGDTNLFQLSIGERVLVSEHVNDGVPVYSANARTPFGSVSKSNLSDFSHPSLLWGIDGNFDWNFIKPESPFATTDHCGRLQVLDENIDPSYVYHYLRSTRAQYGFDRVYRASLGNIRAAVSVSIPVTADGNTFDLTQQRALAKTMQLQHEAKERALSLISEVIRARVTVN